MLNKINNSNTIKFPAPFERLKSYIASPDVALRKAIITQAVIDATNLSELPSAKKFALEAQAWIFGREESFISTCMEGGIEPSFVVKITKGLIKLHKHQSRFKAHSKKRSKNIGVDIATNPPNVGSTFKINKIS